MGRTKDDLIKDAQSRDIPLTGEETVADLKSLLEAAGEPEAEVETEAAEPGEDPRNLGTDPAKHIVVDGGVTDKPQGWDKDRRLNLNGRNVEHVDDLPNGVWVYRSM